MKGGKFTPLTIMNNEDADMDSMITTFNKAGIETASEILGKRKKKKKKNKKKKKKTGSLQKVLISGRMYEQWISTLITFIFYLPFQLKKSGCMTRS